MSDDAPIVGRVRPPASSAAVTRHESGAEPAGYAANSAANPPYDLEHGRYVRLRELCERITKGTTPTTVGYEFTTGGINYIKAEAVNFGGGIDSEKLAFISESAHKALRRSQLREGDVLFSMAGMVIGKSAVVPAWLLPANTNQALGIIRLDPAKADARYINYCFRDSQFNDHVYSLISQSAQPNLNLQEIGNLRIPLPGLPTQRTIARILGALDDKIELNRRMNRTLETLAQRLFKSWFVDFDPVVAKSQNREPFGLSDELAALFPDSFEESELGPIPKGWSLAPLDTLAEFRNGLAMQKFPPGLGEPLPVLKIAELRAGSIAGADQASAGLDPRFVVNDGDLIFSWSGSLMVDIWAGGRAALNQHLFKVVPSEVPQWFCHFWILEHLDDFQGIAADKATTMGHIRRHHLTDAGIVRPEAATLSKLDEVIAPLCERIQRNKLQARKLATLRNLLLPKLLSGEIRVPVAEQAIESSL